MSNAQGRAQVQAYVRGLVGPNRQVGGASSFKLSLPKSYSAGGAGEALHSLPRQLAATAFSKTSKTASNSGGSSIGNAWLISPIASTVKSILNLFGGGGATVQSTHYRSANRQSFRTVESISKANGGSIQQLNESAAGLTGVVSRSLAPAGDTRINTLAPANGAGAVRNGGGTSQLEDRQALITALRRGLSESRGILDVLNEFQDGL